MTIPRANRVTVPRDLLRHMARPFRAVLDPVAFAIERSYCNAAGIYVEGWLHARARAVRLLRVRCGTDRIDVRRFAPRPDVLAHYPEVPAPGHTGFAVYLPWIPGTPISFEIETDGARYHRRVTLPRVAAPEIFPYCLTDGSTARPPPPAQGPDNPLLRFIAMVNEEGGPVAEVGARRVSASWTGMAAHFPGQRYIGIDIHPGPNVDLVGDAHYLHVLTGEGALGATFSLSVLEHLRHPWLFAAAINRALRPGGLVFQSTHQTFPIHEEPNDFWRFSDEGLKVLFGPELGFEVIAAGHADPLYIHNHHGRDTDVLMPCVQAWAQSFVLARKIHDLAPNAVLWPAERGVSEDQARAYPKRD
jgi:hypothetical protein